MAEGWWKIFKKIYTGESKLSLPAVVEYFTLDGYVHRKNGRILCGFDHATMTVCMLEM